MPDLAINVLSATPTQTSIHFHYVARIVPPLVAASVLGAKRLRRPALAAMLVVGAALLGTGQPRSALVVGAETLTRITDPDDRGTRILFGDAAAAVLLVPSHGPGLLAWDVGCDGSAAGLLEVPAGGSRLPASAGLIH